MNAHDFETAARQAKGEYIFCVDSHMIFGHDSIINAVHFMNRRRRQPNQHLGL